MPDDDAITSFRARCKAMREEGATEWDGIKLGPAPVAPTDTDQPSGLTADERVRAQRAERQRVAMLATGGPKPRVVPK